MSCKVKGVCNERKDKEENILIFLSFIGFIVGIIIIDKFKINSFISWFAVFLFFSIFMIKMSNLYEK